MSDMSDICDVDGTRMPRGDEPMPWDPAPGSAPAAPASADARPTIFDPARVLIFDDAEQRVLVDVLDSEARAAGGVSAFEARALLERFLYGQEYVNEADELVRVTLRKRRLEAEVRRCDARITAVESIVVEQWADAGRTGEKHAATGAGLSLQRRLWAKLDIDTTGLDKHAIEAARADTKGAAGAALKACGLDHLVRADFSLNTLSALFRERVKEHDLRQRELPEHERVPLDVSTLLPPELRGLIRLDATPHIQVRSQ